MTEADVLEFTFVALLMACAFCAGAFWAVRK